MANSGLANAKNAKNDEFYTQYYDIEKEMNAYLEYNSDVFKDKTILYHAMTLNGVISQNSLLKTLNDSVLRN